MEKEQISVMTFNAYGNAAAFLVDGEACVLHAYEYTAQRMGAHTITATLDCRECLDDRWTGKEYVMYGGAKYLLDGTPSSSKSNTDHRYSHSLKFSLELDLLLSGTLFLDAVSDAEAVTDRPRSNTTEFNFYGTLSEFVTRLNAVMTYCGLGVEARIDGEIGETEAKQVSFSDSTVLAAIQEAFSVFAVPYWYDLSGTSPCVVFGFVHNAITTPLKYGADSALLKIERNDAGAEIVNRCSGYGSSENIPYYYPNLSPEGTLAVTMTGGAKGVVTDPVKAARLIGKTLTYTKVEPVITAEKIWYVFYGKHTSDNDIVQEGGEAIDNLAVGETGYITPTTSGLTHALYIKPGWYCGGFTVKLYCRFAVTAPCRIKASVSVNGDALTGESYLAPNPSTSIYDSDGKQIRSEQPSLSVGILYEIPKAGIYTLQTVWMPYKFSKLGGNYDVWKRESNFYISDTYKFYCKVNSLSVYDGGECFWKDGDGTVNLSDYGISLKYAALLTEGATLAVNSVPDENGVRKYPVSARLLPYIYRETLARERFYEAVNSSSEFIKRYGDFYPNLTYYSAYARIYKPDGEATVFPNPIASAGHALEGMVEFEDIKPTIEGMTNADGSRIDQILDVAFDTDDDDSLKDDDSGEYRHPNFFVKLRKTDGDDGFNIFDHAIEGEDMTLNMTSGNCAGCSFPIMVATDGRTNLVAVDENGDLVRDSDGNVTFVDYAASAQNDTASNEVWICLRKDADTYGTLMPCKDKYGVAAGDSFAITNISLPQAYITAAEKRLEAAIVKYLLEHNAGKSTFSVTFSTVFTAGDTSVMPMLDENASVLIEYDDKQYSMYVSQYTLKATAGSAIPEVNITVSEEVSESGDGLRQVLAQAKAATDDAVANIDVTKLGLPYFLRKDIDDIAKGNPDFVNGIRVGNYVAGLLGAGGAFSVDGYGNSTLEADYINVRKKATFNELEVQKTTGAGGQIVVSCASGRIISVEETDTAYRCRLRTSDGNGDTMLNLFAKGDLVRSQTFGAARRAYYWRKCTEVGDDYIDLSKTECEDGSDIPAAGDSVVQLGSATDAKRQGAQILSCYGDNTPSFLIYDGISAFSLDGCLKSGFRTVDVYGDVTTTDDDGNETTGTGIVSQKAEFFVYGRGYIGDSEREKYIESENGNLTVQGTINALEGVISGLLQVTDAAKTMKAGINGGDLGKDSTHGKLLVFAGADSSQSTQSEQMASSATRIYEDGHLVTKSADIEGKITATSGKITGLQVSVSKSPFMRMSTTQSGTGQYNKITEFDNGYGDFWPTSGSSTISYQTLPCDVNQCGRRIVLVGYAYVNTESGYYIWDTNGKKVSGTTISDEIIEFIGYGTETKFIAWIVLSRRHVSSNINYYSGKYPFSPLAIGKMTCSSSGSVSLTKQTFDDAQMYAARTAVGRYRLYLPYSWFSDAKYIYCMLTGFKTASDSLIKPSIESVGSTTYKSATMWYVEVSTSDDATENEGGFQFMIFNYYSL